MPNDYFELPINEALALAAAQVNVVIEETENYGGNRPDFYKHQIIKTAEIVRFLGAMVAAQQQEIAALKNSTPGDKPGKKKVDIEAFINGKRNVTRCAICASAATGCTLVHTLHGIYPAVGLCDDHLENNLRARRENAEQVLLALQEFTAVHSRVYGTEREEE